jgi:PPOX class probable F420-dependent enzyme
MEYPPDAERRIASDEVAWLTTVTDGGAPAPNPVWFVRDGDDLVVFSEPTSRKVHNIEQRPHVSLHFNSDAHGGDIVVVNGVAELTHDTAPSATAGFLDKYEAAITGPLQMTTAELDARYNTRIQIHPARVRLT